MAGGSIPCSTRRGRQPHFFLGGGGGGGGGFLAVEGLGEALSLDSVRPPEDRLGGGFCSFAMIDSRRLRGRRAADPGRAGPPYSGPGLRAGGRRSPLQESQRLRRR